MIKSLIQNSGRIEINFAVSLTSILPDARTPIAPPRNGTKSKSIDRANLGCSMSGRLRDIISAIRRIMAILPIKNNSLCFGLIFGTLVSAASPSIADSQVAVLPNDFNCILKHKKDYRAQGDIITLNFETCPEPPSFSERLRAHDAQNVFPQPNPDRAEQPSSRDTTAGPKILSAMIVTKAEFECLIANINLVEFDEGSGRLLILPDRCQDLSHDQ